MEINFLVFPAPKCSFKEEDLKGELVWIPYIPNLWKKEKKENIEIVGNSKKPSTDTINFARSQESLQKFKQEFQRNFLKTSSGKPLTRGKINFQKQFPLNPPDQQPQDLSQTIYDDGIDEDPQKQSMKRYCSPKNLDCYSSGNFKNRNCFSTQNLHADTQQYFSQQQSQSQSQQAPDQIKRFSQSSIPLNLLAKYNYVDVRQITQTVSDQIKGDEDIDNDLSLIQGENMPHNTKPSTRINDFVQKASKCSTPQSQQMSIYARIAEQNNLIKSTQFSLRSSLDMPQRNQHPKYVVLHPIGERKTIQKEIPCLYLKAKGNARFLMLFFHGNGEDIYHSYQLLDQVRNDLNVNIMAMEYPGYGLYKGQPSEGAILQDATYVYQYLTKHSGIEEKDIIVFGRSIGTGAATYIASLFNPAMLVLMSPFLTLREVVKHSYGNLASNLIQDRFKNKENIKKVQCPTFILHGQRDNIIPVSHSIELHRLCGGVCELVTPILMDHVRFLFTEDLTNPLREFMRANNLLERKPNIIKRLK